MAHDNLNVQTNQGRKVSILLILGIIFVPYIFAWFLLREGYSKQARILGFGWLIVVLLILISPNKKESDTKESLFSKQEDPRESTEVLEDDSVDEPLQEEPEETVKSVRLEDLMPQKEKEIIEVLQKGWEKSEFSYTSAEKYKIIKERKSVLSNGYQINDWIGTVYMSEYVQEANAISLSIQLYQGKDLYQNISVGTGIASDPKRGVPTTIKEGSALFNTALELNHGDKVQFSGTLYLKDYSPVTRGRADDNPLDDFGQLAFLTKFTKLKKLE